MSSTTAADRTQAVIARIERIPFSTWHVKMRMIIGVATFFDALDALMIATILPVLIREWHLRPDQVGLLISVGYVGQAAGAIFFGWLADRAGRVTSMIATIALYAVMSIVSAFSWSYASLFVCRTIQGIGLGGEVPVAASYISEFSKAKGRGRFVLLYEQIFVVGVVAASLLGLFIVPRWGWRTMFWIGAIPAVIALLLRWLVPESPRWLATKGRIEEAEEVVSNIEKAVSRKTTLPPVSSVSYAPLKRTTDWRELFRGRYLRRTLVVWVVYFCTYFCVNGLSVWVPTIFTRVFRLPLQTGLRYGFYLAALGLVTAFLAAFLIDKSGRKPWITVAFFLGAACSIILWLTGARTADTVLVLALAAYFPVSSLGGALYLYVPELYPTRLRGIGASVATAWLRTGSATAPILIGFILSKATLSWVFLMFGCVALVGALVALIFGVETKDKVLEEISP